MNEKQESRYASRKFLLAILMVVVGVGMTLHGSLTQQLVDLMKWTAGMYFGLNVTQKAAEMFTSSKGSQ